MASLTRETQTKRRRKLHRQGRKRKNRLAKRSTLSYQEIFAGLGEPQKS
jgi:hypothetical protein